MTGDNIAALVEYQERHRNGHTPQAEPVSDDKLIRRMSDVTSRTIHWAWKGRMACGYITVQSGEEGLGKSVFNAWLIARATRGELEGIWHKKPVDVLVVASEDGLEDTWQPRLTLAEADTDRVASLNLDELPADWNIRDGIDDLRRAVVATASKLIVFDALLDNLPAAAGGENINSPTYVRSALGPLKQLIRELGLVAVISLHPPKARGFAYRDFVQGSQAFSAVSRFGLLFGWHPDDADDDPDRRRVLVRGKGNLGRNPGALEFRVTGRDHRHGDGIVDEREVVVDVQRSDVTLAQLTARPHSAADESHSKAERAADILRERLAGGEWHASTAIRAGLDALDLNSDSVVSRAKQLADVETRKAPGSPQGAWEWRLRRTASKNPEPPIHLNTDSWAQNSPNPQYPRDESKNPPLVTADSCDGAGYSSERYPECGHPARWWRPKGGVVWICDLCHPAPETPATIEWSLDDALGEKRS